MTVTDAATSAATLADLEDLPPDLSPGLSAIRLLWSRWPRASNGGNDDAHHIYLRPPRRSDLQAVWDIHSDPRVHRFNPNGPDSWKGAKDRLAGWLHDWHQRGTGYMAVVQRGPLAAAAKSQSDLYTERIVGFTGVRFFDLPNQFVPQSSPLIADTSLRHVRDGKERILNIYYRFSPLVAGQGIAYHAVRLVILNALRSWPDHQLAIMTPPDNRPSRTLAERLGFRPVRQTTWSGIPHVDYRLFDAERDAFLRRIQDDASAASSPIVPLLLRRLGPNDVESQMQIMQTAFFEQIRPLFTEVPLDEPVPAPIFDQWIVYQRCRIRALLEEEALAQGVRTISVIRLDQLPAADTYQDAGEVQPHIIGLVTYELPEQHAASQDVDARYSHLSRDEVRATWDRAKQQLTRDPFPCGNAAGFDAIKARMAAYRLDEMGEAPHYSLRLFCFRPDCRSQGVGKTVLEWLMYSACGEVGGDRGYYPRVPAVEQHEGTVLGATALSEPGSDVPRLPMSISEERQNERGRLPWYLDATTPAMPFYRRFGFGDTAMVERHGPVGFLTPQQSSYLHDKYGDGSEDGARTIDQLSMRLNPMVYRPPGH
ncbi:uncharacterized protein PFL1_03403 [Pseudozyma flocculosa PF-1]|uniref:N-acetyltransferase domain-containing protein n=2 Tax=Pseudozyma flocculosa TaxID=84751 RepID=A0A5C3F9Q3_9BASI|nr:uncharacterized protein PFL1_03403 [Pseudozyma flocculosa PF-1]EPQ29115.1 hypothetical protein PFL1_03403 [Pseudozyma flocculosa PF-1]SPO40109.1 uncharacterized protein PSFLO_05591 [Pseudozyma flocculosa]